MSSLELNQVRKTFGPTVALEQLDLALGEGELVCLLGPSGCGKTTALRIVAGFDQPDSGDVFLAGDNITRRPANKRDMGMVFQAYSLFPNLTAEENVAFGLRLRRQSARTASQTGWRDARTRRAERTSEALRAAALRGSTAACRACSRSPSSPRCCCSTNHSRPSMRR